MARRFTRLLGAAALALAAGCRIDTSGGVVGYLDKPLDIGAGPTAAQVPAPAEPSKRVPPGTPLKDRLRVPPELPGADAPPLNLPTEPERKTERNKLLDEVFPELPQEAINLAGASSDLAKLDLPALQELARTTHPSIRQAANAVESARGAAVQVGLPPNPTIGFEADTVGSGGTAGQQGAKLEQIIKTAGKLKLAQAAALIDVTNAEVALRKTCLDLATQVRTGYFNVLCAEENLRVASALALFAEEAYRVEVDQVKAGQAAGYEPLQLRALAVQARAARSTARIRYQSEWRQLAAALGRADMPPQMLAGGATMAVPALDFDRLRDRMVATHTDVRSAENSVMKARYNLRLAQVTPIPDVALKLVVQKDYTTPPFYTTANVEVGVPLPVWDRNQGGIKQAESELAKQLDEANRVRLDLQGKLADAAERYQTSRLLVELYRNSILPDQARGYRGVLARYQQEPQNVLFNDVLTAQQNLGTSLQAYLAALGGMWKAVVDLAALGQVEDIYDLR